MENRFPILDGKIDEINKIVDHVLQKPKANPSLLIRPLKPDEAHTLCDVKSCTLGAVCALEHPKEIRIEYLCFKHTKDVIDDWERQKETEENLEVRWWER